MNHSSIAFVLLLSLFSSMANASNSFMNLVNPYLEAKLASKGNMYAYDEKGLSLGLSPKAKEAEELFNKLLTNKSTDGDKALAYLLFIYVGSGPGTELVCEVVNRGNQMVPIINTFMVSLPKSSLGSNLKVIQTNDPALLARRAQNQISKNEVCEFFD